VSLSHDERLALLLREQESFDAQRVRLAAEGHAGKVALWKDGALVALFATETEAYVEGLRRFGSGGVFLIDVVGPKRVIHVYASTRAA